MDPSIHGKKKKKNRLKGTPVKYFFSYESLVELSKAHSRWIEAAFSLFYENTPLGSSVFLSLSLSIYLRRACYCKKPLGHKVVQGSKK